MRGERRIEKVLNMRKNMMRNLFVLIFAVLLNLPAFAAYQGSVSYVPAGTPVSVTLNQALGSQFSQVGQTFSAGLASPIYAGSSLVAPPGSQVEGTVVAVVPAGRGGKPAELDLRLTNILTPDGKRIPLSASIDKANFQLKADGGRTSHFAKATAGGAAAGALSGLIGGAISGGKFGKSTAIGTGIGAGVGVLGGAIKKGQELIVNQGEQIAFKLDAPIQAQTNSAPPVQQIRPEYGSQGSYGQPQTNPYAQQQQVNPYAQQQPSGGFADPRAGSGGYQPVTPPPPPPQPGYGGYQSQQPTNPYL